MSQRCTFWATFPIPSHRLKFETFEFVMSHIDDPYADKDEFKRLYDEETDETKKENLANVLEVVSEIARNSGQIVDADIVDFENPSVIGSRKPIRRKGIEITGKFDSFDDLEKCYNAVIRKTSCR